jgi:hypothetical protein
MEVLIGEALRALPRATARNVRRLKVAIAAMVIFSIVSSIAMIHHPEGVETYLRHFWVHVPSKYVLAGVTCLLWIVGFILTSITAVVGHVLREAHRAYSGLRRFIDWLTIQDDFEPGPEMITNVHKWPLFPYSLPRYMRAIVLRLVYRESELTRVARIGGVMTVDMMVPFNPPTGAHVTDKHIEQARDLHYAQYDRRVISHTAAKMRREAEVKCATIVHFVSGITERIYYDENYYCAAMSHYSAMASPSYEMIREFLRHEAGIAVPDHMLHNVLDGTTRLALAQMKIRRVLNRLVGDA